MGYELREHTADVAIEATAGTFAGVIEEVAAGLTAAQADDIPDTGERFDIEVRAESREALLFDTMDTLIYERDVRGVLPTAFDFAVEDTGGDWILTGSARGVPVEDVAGREIKAVTYSEIILEETDTGWHAYVVFDV